MRKRNACMQCNEEKLELIFICHDEDNGCFVWEKINAIDKSIFIINFFFLKNGVEDREAQYTSLCALNKIGSITPRVLRSLDASSQGKFPNP